jgi:glycosyltransferase involved in cell wall biosynthesis
VSTAPSPLVSVVLAAHDADAYLGLAIESVLGQTFSDLELVVVDDCSSDTTPEILASVDDPRLVVCRNDSQLGLAGSLNRGLDRARGRWVARLDADDAMLQRRLELQLTQVRRTPGLAVVGTGVAEMDAYGRIGRVHQAPSGKTAVRWQALFGAPFFHPTVLVDREVLDGNGLRYDPAYLESEDYDLWSRLLAVADGVNLAEPLVLRRVHPQQASRRRGDVQQSFQRRVAMREIAVLAPQLDEGDAELAWSVGALRPLGKRSGDRAAHVFLALHETFEREHGRNGEVRLAAARALARAGFLRQAVELDPLLPAHVGAARFGRRARLRRVRPEVEAVLASTGRRDRREPIRVTVVSPEPTPYRSPLLDLVAGRSELALTVIYAARTVAGRAWEVEPRHRAVFLRGVRVPGLRRLLRHDYPVTPGILRALREECPDVVVVSGWSTFASQVAIAWSRATRTPYVLLVSSHEAGVRSGLRRATRHLVVPRVVRAAAGALVLGSLARAALVASGAQPERVRIFANTIDVEAWGERVDRLAGRREELRAAIGAADGDVVVLSVARLVPEKGLDVLVRAAGQAEDERLLVVLVGSGPERARLDRLAVQLGVRMSQLGEVPYDRLPEVYAAADVFALLSTWEPWGVVVNEAAACALPLVLSDQVGAAPDLLRDAENGFLVRSGDVAAASAALRWFAGDPAGRLTAGARSREVVRGWGYGPSVENFVTAVREAAAR